MQITVDDRECSSGVVGHLKSFDGVSVEISRMKAGDYCVAGSWLVERKTLTDLVASIIDGRFFRQLYRLLESGKSPVLLLEGTSAVLHGSGMSREAIQGALMTTTLFMGIPILRSMSSAETASLLVAIARQQKELLQPSHPLKHHYPVRRPKGKLRNQMMVLQSLPGVGAQRAAALLKKFGSVEKIFESDAIELAEVNGVGKKTAEKIKWVIEEGAPEYQLPFFDL